MADLNLLDLAARTNSDAVIGLVESAITYAPELSFLPVLPKRGTSYKVTRRTSLPIAQFSANGSGVPTSKSTYVQETKDMYHMEVQLEIPDSIVQGADDTLGDLMAQEADGAIKSAFIHLAQQMYYGGLTSSLAPTNFTVDNYGFSGIVSMINGDAVHELSAGGAAGSSTSAYLVALHDQGASLAVSEGQLSSLTVDPWLKVPVIVSGAGTNSNPFKKTQAYTSAFNGWFGFTVANVYTIYRVRNIDPTHPLTDALGNQLLAQIPTEYRKGLRWFVNEFGSYSLQKARSSVGYQPAGSTGNPGYADEPTSLAGIPLTVTSTILNTEQ